MKIPPIDIKKFYFIGKWCFFVMAIMMLAGWIDSLKVAEGIMIVKGFANVVLNFALFGFFSWMYNQQAKTKALNDDELIALAGYIEPKETKEKKHERNIK